MDWSLALASQEIGARIERGDGDWILSVEAADLPRAEETIALYERENPRGAWQWRQSFAADQLEFHWGAIFWAIVLAAVYGWSTEFVAGAVEIGAMDNHAVARGEWWRLFTAVTLHADLGHLVANLSTGLILFGLAMAQYGPGPALLGSFLAGALGNGAGFIFYGVAHRGLGASGMVMGALGMLGAQAFRHPGSGLAGHVAARGAAAALLLFIFWGTTPGTDILAHAGGFIGGLAAGFLAGRAPPHRSINRQSLVAVWALLLLTWWLALRGR